MVVVIETAMNSIAQPEAYVGRTVWVYRNLGKGPNYGKFSILDPKTGLVVGRVRQFLLSDVKFRVRKGGQAAVRRLHKKNVHAFAIGTLRGFNGFIPGEPIRYDPYKHDGFMSFDKPVAAADYLGGNVLGLTGVGLK